MLVLCYRKKHQFNAQITACHYGDFYLCEEARTWYILLEYTGCVGGWFVLLWFEFLWLPALPLQMKHSMEEFRNLATRYGELYQASFDADSATLRNVELYPFKNLRIL